MLKQWLEIYRKGVCSRIPSYLHSGEYLHFLKFALIILLCFFIILTVSPVPEQSQTNYIDTDADC
jgi:hypothetical protein